MISLSQEKLTQPELSQLACSESDSAAEFTSRLMSAKPSAHQKRPWVMVIPSHKAQTLLSVYYSLKSQGVFECWSREFYDVRKDSGICVFALMP